MYMAMMHILVLLLHMNLSCTPSFLFTKIGNGQCNIEALSLIHSVSDNWSRMSYLPTRWFPVTLGVCFLCVIDCIPFLDVMVGLGYKAQYFGQKSGNSVGHQWFTAHVELGRHGVASGVTNIVAKNFCGTD